MFIDFNTTFQFQNQSTFLIIQNSNQFQIKEHSRNTFFYDVTEALIFIIKSTVPSQLKMKFALIHSFIPLIENLH
jgi:hypothetical protein